MYEKQISTIKKHLTVKEDEVLTTSLDVANSFDKKHKHVIEVIRKLINTPECPSDFGRSNFRPSSYVNEQNKEQPMYELTRDGFTLLAMRFSGPKAYKFQIAYIEAFNQMEKGLQSSKQLLDELLTARPLWGNIKRYMGLGLSRKEVCLLTNLHKDTVRKHLRRMENLGIIAPPVNLKELQAKVQPMLPGMEA